MSWCGLDLTFDLAVVTLTYKILSGYILDTIRCRKLILGRVTAFSYDKDMWIAATDCHIYFYTTVLFSFLPHSP